MAIGIKNIAELLPGSFSLTGGVVSIGNGEYVDAESPEGRAILEQRRAKAEQQRAAGIVTNTGGRTNLGMTYRNMGALYNPTEKAPLNTMFGQGEMGFNNTYNSLLGRGMM